MKRYKIRRYNDGKTKIKNSKICSICHKPFLSNFSTIFQKGADCTNEVSRLDNFTVTPGMYVYVSCRKNYTRIPGVHSSSTEVFDRKTKTSSEGLNFRKDCFYCGCVIKLRQNKTKKSCNVSCKNREVVKESIKLSLTGKMMSRPMKLNDPWLLWTTFMLKTQCTMYSVVQIFRLIKVIQGKPSCWRKTTAEKETLFLEIAEHIKSHSDEQFNITTLRKMMKKRWMMFYIWFKQLYLMDNFP